MMDTCRRQFLAGCGAALSRLVPGWAAGQGSAYVRLFPSKAGPGQRVEIQWAAPHASSVYLLGWGQFAPSGRLEITSGAAFPRVVLVAESPAGAALLEAPFELTGVRGDGGEWEENRKAYRYPYVHRLPPYAEYGRMLDSIVAVVQNEFQGVQRQILFNSTVVTVQTSRLEPPELQQGLPRHYYGRRISYLIEAPGPAAFRKATPVDITILSLIEARRRREPTWFVEDAQELYRTATRRLVKMLGPG